MILITKATARCHVLSSDITKRETFKFETVDYCDLGLRIYLKLNQSTLVV